MKKFTINCDFGGQLAPFTIYIGNPEASHHPLHFQADWLSKQRGGMIPGEVMEAISQLQELSVKNNVSLEELCVYALGTAEEDAEDTADSEEQIESEEDIEDVAAPLEQVEPEDAEDTTDSEEQIEPEEDIEDVAAPLEQAEPEDAEDTADSEEQIEPEEDIEDVAAPLEQVEPEAKKTKSVVKKTKSATKKPRKKEG